MEPRHELVAAGVSCLARPGAHYVCYAPAGGRIELDLSTAAGAFKVEWLYPRTGKTRATGPVRGGAKRFFDCPDAGDWVLYGAAGKP